MNKRAVLLILLGPALAVAACSHKAEDGAAINDSAASETAGLDNDSSGAADNAAFAGPGLNVADNSLGLPGAESNGADLNAAASNDTAPSNGF